MGSAPTAWAITINSTTSSRRSPPSYLATNDWGLPSRFRVLMARLFDRMRPPWLRVPSAARTVRLFVVDGSPNGLMTAEIVNWSGKIVVAPRSRLADLLARKEAGRTGVYLLAGLDPARASGRKLYVGEADDVRTRLRRHDAEEAMDFFDRVAIVISTDENLTKAHVRVLESQLIRLAAQAVDTTLVNGTALDFAGLPEADLADMESFLEQLLMVLPILGVDLFRQAASGRIEAESEDRDSAAGQVFELSSVGVDARARVLDDEFLVLAGRRPAKPVPRQCRRATKPCATASSRIRN